ncbi:MAG: YMGG-like glycine zipper-containing protein [Ginsengibacter sp.]
MKNFLLSIALITGFAACNNTPKQENSRDIQLLTDTTSYHNNFYSDTSRAVNAALVPAAEVKAEPRVITITKRVIYTPAKTVNEAPVYQPQVNTPPVTPTVPTPEPAATGTTDNTVQTGNGTSTNTEPATTTQTEKKKGWSSAAKGAAIGAGAGAIGGAIISKKKGLGAVVGGVVGAAGGYIIGKDIDKRKAGN